MTLPLLLRPLTVALLLALCFVVKAHRSSTSPLKLGSRDRFWKHHVTQKTLKTSDGMDHYQEIQTCLYTKLTESERQALKSSPQRQVGTKFYDASNETTVILVAIQNAMLPIHAKAVQSLAACVRQSIPSLYESRPMYQEFNLDQDPGLGGNCPTHLGALIPIFLPDVRREMDRTLEFAFFAGNWSDIATAEKQEGLPLSEALPEPNHVGIKASEHLTYNDFKEGLADHIDGTETAYTCNFAFSGPDDYQGGDYYIVSGHDDDHQYIKPDKYGALVFLGGRYPHGVTEITGGQREMFSTEFWAYPDMPFGSTLWTSVPENMEDYIERCNSEEEQGGTGPCQASFSTVTSRNVDIEDVRKKYSSQSDDDKETMADATRSRRIKPDSLKPVKYGPVRFKDDAGKEYDISSFRSQDVEPDFLIPNQLAVGEMVPIRWRDTLQPVDGSEGETFVIGLPPELYQEFQAYIERNGMMEIAQKILYEERPIRPNEHRLYTLEDGMKWGAMIQGEWDTDMIWLDPADEECFESLLAVLGRGGFDAVLDTVGRAFDLDSLMVQGVGAIFLSEYEVSANMHSDIPGSKGSFYNIIVPVHIPKNNTATFYIGDQVRDEKGTTMLNPDVGVVVGGESLHGTGECNYRETKEFRLSFAIYVADINEENVDLIASDSTSLWPTEGDTDWFWAQKGRLWSRKGGKSLKNDTGRAPLQVKDKHVNCADMSVDKCLTDPLGMRLRCPKTCQLYLEDDVYYSKLQEEHLSKKSPWSSRLSDEL